MRRRAFSYGSMPRLRRCQVIDDALKVCEAAITDDDLATSAESALTKAGIQSFGAASIICDARAIRDLIQRVRAQDDEIEAIREAMGGYDDSDLVSLATTLNRSSEAFDDALERLEKATGFVRSALKALVSP